jgi:phage terminase large subunit
MQLAIDLPRKARDTLFPAEWKRFKVLYGGRDGAKSWSMGRAALARGRAKPERILCVREVQKSIADSVHQLLRDQSTALGLDDFYSVKRDYIEGDGGTLFAFRGLSSETALSLKSFERPTICWVEEGQAISKRSWGILEPTIRAPQSEIWVGFNPELNDDFIYRQFVHDYKGELSVPEQSIVTKIGWEDNPWRSQVLDTRREQMKREQPEEYMHVYGGECRPAVEGAIYYQEVTKLKSSGRLCNIPYDPMLKVHVVCDLGFNDYMSLILVQRLASEIRVIRYIEDRLRYIPSYHQELADLKLNYGKLYLPHDGKAKHVTGSSAEEQFRALGWDVEIIPDIGLEQGIRKTREVFGRFYMDKSNASELVNRLGRYRRRVNSEGQASTPMHDDESHGADGTRYLAIVADQMSNDVKSIVDPYSAFRGRSYAA